MNPDLTTNQKIKEFAQAHGLEFIGEGFDNVVYADVARQTAWRFPKKADREQTLRQEAIALSHLVHLDAIIPAPILKEESGLVYGEYPFVSGTHYEQLSPTEQTDLLRKSSVFLGKLHRFQHPDLQILEKINSYARFQAVHEGLRDLKDILNSAQMTYAENVFGSFLKHPEYADLPLALVHGDFSQEHVYYQSGQIAVIDWSDFQLADPAYEFHHLLNELPTEAHQILVDNYDAGADHSFWERAYAYRYMDTFEVLLQAFQAGNTVRVQEFVREVDQDMIRF